MSNDSVSTCIYLIFNVMMVSAAKMMVTIQKRIDEGLALWVQLTVLCAEVVVDRCALEDALLDALALA